MIIRPVEIVDRSSLALGQVEIRNCKAGDLRAIQRIENTSFDDPYSSMIFWSFYLSPRSIFRVAVLNQKIAGYCIVTIDRSRENDPDGTAGHFAHLASLAVEPEARRKGIASKLMEDVISRTKKGFSDIKRMELEVRVDNEAAIALYSKFGFKKSKIIPDYYGVGEDGVLMILLLL